MKVFGTLAAGLSAACLIVAADVALAQDAKAAAKARQGQFRIMALNLGVLGGMAKGEVEYNKELAQYVADNLVTVSMLHQQVNWPAGSDNGAFDGTRAKPEIWSSMADFQSKWNDFGTAAKAMQTAAGESAQAIGGAIGAVGGTCKACHDAYRAPAN